MWGANMVLLAVGLLMVSRMNRVSGTTRGGDWSELRETGSWWHRELVGEYVPAVTLAPRGEAPPAVLDTHTFDPSLD